MSILQIIGFIVVGIVAVWFPFALAKSIGNTDGALEKTLENFPDKIVINIKHEKNVSDKEIKDDDKNESDTALG